MRSKDDSSWPDCPLCSGEITGEPEFGGRSAPTPQPPLIIPLEMVNEGQRWLVGGKAANLASLLRGKLPVPRGFCVTVVAFEEFLDSSGKRAELSRLLSAISTTSSLAVEEVGRQAMACLAACQIPPCVVQEVLAAWRAMGIEKSYAVRFSATVEDATEHSFAGQFESVLNVRGRDGLLAALRRCWLSSFSSRALAYHAKEGLRVDNTAVAVVIEEILTDN